MDKITLNLTQQEVNIIGEALLDKPARMTLDLINNINSQIIEQNNKLDEEESEDK